MSWLFLRLLALVYLAAFISTGVQIVGLAGAEGILPFAEELHRVETEFGLERHWRYPTLFWISASDIMLQGACVAGCVFTVLLFLNVLPRISLILLFVLYLSLFHAGQIFMNFQWDYLLLESGFLAIFLPGGTRLVIWLYRWVLFRLRFLSGVSKLLSQDPSWADLTALNYFFETQPLPHWGGWYAHQLPEGFLRFCTGSALFIELVVPFMMFLPRPFRLFGAWATLLMQVLILLTANHNYANFLVIALCLFLFDDRAISRIVPRWVAVTPSEKPAGGRPVRSRTAVLLGSLAGVILLVSTLQMWEMFTGRRSPELLAAFTDAVKPFRIVNKYHVFPTMPTQRIEVIVEGSQDGESWHPYAFKYKPGELSRRPEVVVPHQPRLDWLMWFVTSHPMFLSWFDSFLQGLLKNSPAVVALLARNPFPEEPPQYLRVSVYRYRFSDMPTHEATGQWWTREYLGPFFPLPWLEAS